MTINSFDARGRLAVGDMTYDVYRLDRVDGSRRLPYSLKVLLENLLRCEDGRLVTAEQVGALAAWDPAAGSGTEIRFTAIVRIDTPAVAEYFRHGGILPYVLRQLLAS